MDFTAILVLGLIISLIDLLIINSNSNVVFKLKFINKVPKVTIKSKYFFLPLTTKIREYNDVQAAHVKHRMGTRRSGGDKYDLELELKNKWRRILVFGSETDYQKISKYCDEINYALKNFQDYSVLNNDSSKVISTVIWVLIVSLPIVCVPIIKGKLLMDYICCFAIILIILSICFGLSSIVNKSKKKKQILYNNNKENVDIDSEADRINDSIIK